MPKSKKNVVKQEETTKKEEKVSKTPWWDKIAPMQMEAFGFPQEVKKYFDFLLENDKMLCLKPKTQASAMISFLESALNVVFKAKKESIFELEIGKNGIVEIKKL